MKEILPEVEKAYAVLNKSLFGDLLRVPAFILAPRKRGVIHFCA